MDERSLIRKLYDYWEEKSLNYQNCFESKPISKLSFTIGLARSGKSTFAEQWVNEKSKRVVIDLDKIRLALHGNRYNSLSESVVIGMKPVMIRAFLLAGYEVLVDDTHTTERSIKGILDIDPDANLFFFDTEPEECIRRAHATGQSDLVPVIERMAEQLWENFAESHFSDWVEEEFVVQQVDIWRKEIRKTQEYSKRVV